MTEIQIQSKAYQWLWNTHPETRRCFFHVPNGGSRNVIEATQLKASGVIAGIPDTLLIWGGKVHAFEFKTPTGTVSADQRKVHEAWRHQGVKVNIIRSVVQFKEEVLQIIKPRHRTYHRVDVNHFM